MNSMDYNTQRAKLSLPEYGRNIHKMVLWAASIEDRNKRNEQIRAVIAVMGNLNPHLRDVNDFKHKLWDHVQIISDFKIDIDSPYPIPTSKTLNEKPRKVPYQNKILRARHYGRCLQNMIEKIAKMDDGEQKKYLTIAIANQMKKAAMMWNKETVKDEQIYDDLRKLSNGALLLDENTKLYHGKVQNLLESNNAHTQQKPQNRKNNNNNGKQQKMKFKNKKK